ncbi:DUF2202 domain-containing protein [bacterium]|nr:DUF2202 domain-containing protein [bacterium]
MTDLNDLPVEPVSEEEASGLIFMRQEEKLAGDVYTALFGQWELQVFSNIAASEDAHTNAVRVLLDRYELADPVVNDQPGVFADAALTELYTSLLATGGSSLTGALQVGAEIEEIDILDLQHQLNTIVDNEDIAFVYNNLLRGSYNHLRAFVTSLARQGVVYTPQHLDDRQYDEIVVSESSRGGRGFRGGR